MAKAMAQHFMDARLIENAADRSSNLFKERGIFVLTPKGLHVLERFISKNGMSADHLVRVFATQPICMKLLHLERRASDDDIIITDPVIFALFRRFAGRAPNYMPNQADTPMDASTEYHERAKGIPLQDVQERSQQMIGKGSIQTVKYCFPAVGALEWLCDFTSIVGRDEAAEMAGHFVRHNLITVVSDKRKGSDQAIIFTVRGSTENGAAPVCPLLASQSRLLILLVSRPPSSDAPQRPFIELLKKVAGWQDGKTYLMAAVLLPSLLQISLPVHPGRHETVQKPVVMKLPMAPVPLLQTHPPSLPQRTPRFIAVSPWLRSLVQRTKLEKATVSTVLLQRAPIPTGYVTSSKNPRFARYSVNSFAETFVKKICRSGWTCKISNEGSIQPLVLVQLARLVPRHPVGRTIRLVNLRWKSIMKR